eukprot:scaffold127904_cov63-Phaeocystis_antarctica.AAC.3
MSASSPGGGRALSAAPTPSSWTAACRGSVGRKFEWRSVTVIGGQHLRSSDDEGSLEGVEAAAVARSLAGELGVARAQLHPYHLRRDAPVPVVTELVESSEVALQRHAAQLLSPLVRSARLDLLQQRHSLQLVVLRPPLGECARSEAGWRLLDEAARRRAHVGVEERRGDEASGATDESEGDEPVVGAQHTARHGRVPRCRTRNARKFGIRGKTPDATCRHRSPMEWWTTGARGKSKV